MQVSMPEREHVDLEDAEVVDVVLVPLDEAALGHRAVADRHRLGEQLVGQDEAADVLAEVAWHADHLLGQLEDTPEMGVGQVEPGLAPDVVLVDLVAVPAPYRAGEHGRHVFRQAHRLADLADRHARAVVDHRGAQARAVAAVLLVDVLDHLLAPLVLEIDVDVGRLAAFLGDEAVEQQLVLGRIDLGDAEAEAHRRIRRAAAPLAQDRRLLRAGEVDDFLDSQEVGRRSGACRSAPAHA